MNNVTILTGNPTVRVLAEPAMIEDTLDDVADDNDLEGALSVYPHGGVANAGLHERDLTDAELLPEFSGRICYDAFGPRASGKSNAEYLANVRNAKPFGHLSIEYHVTLVFLVEGVSRNLSHELIRHYVGCNRDEQGAPSQESTRYIEHPGTFVCPPAWVDRAELVEAFRATVGRAYDAYRSSLDLLLDVETKEGGRPKGMARKRIYEACRSMLPGSATTRLVWSANPVALRKMFTERGHEAADLEFRRLVSVWRPLCEERWPNLFPKALDWADGPVAP